MILLWLTEHWQVALSGLGALAAGLVAALKVHLANKHFKTVAQDLAKREVAIDNRQQAVAEAEAKAQIKGESDVEALRRFNAGSEPGGPPRPR